MSEEQKLQNMTDWASLFLEPGETIRAAAWGPWSELAFLLGVAAGGLPRSPGATCTYSRAPCGGG